MNSADYTCIKLDGNNGSVINLMVPNEEPSHDNMQEIYHTIAKVMLEEYEEKELNLHKEQREANSKRAANVV
ncbi:hypothetical protein NSQ26_05815 [Bacillus sp. FSL W7-1360]